MSTLPGPMEISVSLSTIGVDVNHPKPSTVGRTAFAWCRELFETNPDAIRPVLYDDPVTHVQVLAVIEAFSHLGGSVRVTALRNVQEPERYYQIHFDHKKHPTYFTVFTDGSILGSYNHHPKLEVPPPSDFITRLRRLTPIAIGLFGYRDKGEVLALVGFSSVNRARPTIYGLEASKLPGVLHLLTWTDFWRMHAAGMVVSLSEVFAKGSLWELDVPLHLVKTPPEPVLVGGRLPAIVWEGPAEAGLPERATYVYATDASVWCPAVRWPSKSAFELIGEDIVPHIRQHNERYLFMLGLP